MINYTIYENETSSQWVTFVHGAGGSSSIWFKQIRDFKKQYNVLLLDLIRYGNFESTLNTISFIHNFFIILINGGIRK
jgi:pimeloyl-ACP methyl ester carboxylesterase